MSALARMGKSPDNEMSDKDVCEAIAGLYEIQEDFEYMIDLIPLDVKEQKLIRGAQAIMRMYRRVELLSEVEEIRRSARRQKRPALA